MAAIMSLGAALIRLIANVVVGIIFGCKKQSTNVLYNKCFKLYKHFRYNFYTLDTFR